VPYDIIFQVLVVLAAAVTLGELFEQLRLPSVAGELAAGLILGPTLLKVVSTSPGSQALSSIALFFIIFLIGFEMKTETLQKHFVEAILVTMTSFVVPLILVFAITLTFFSFGAIEDFIAALAIAVPSISIISVIVMQRGLTREKTGELILSSVIVSDTVAFVMLATVTKTESATLNLLVYLSIFLVVFAGVDRLLTLRAESFQRLLDKSSRILKREDVSYTILIVIGLLISLIFQSIGLSYIVGSFFAGLIVHEELVGRQAFTRFEDLFSRMNRGFFIPVFFGFAGVEAILTPSDFSLLGVLLLAITASLGSSIPLTYFFTRSVLKHPAEADPRSIAVILGGRGAVGIVIVTVALDSGLISSTVYSLVIFGTTLVSVLVPLLLRRTSRLPVLENK
jgi:Kef-type K+ transport system membrane component KefB